jgi:hypothetical protein
MPRTHLGKGEPPQQMAKGKLDLHKQNNEIGSLSNTISKKASQNG